MIIRKITYSQKIQAQIQYITKRFGKEVAEHAQYCWKEDGLMIITKVYDYGLLSTTSKNGKIKHSFLPFS